MKKSEHKLFKYCSQYDTLLPMVMCISSLNIVNKVDEIEVLGNRLIHLRKYFQKCNDSEQF